MEEQHTFGVFGYFHVPCHKYQPTKVTLCPDLKPLPPPQAAQIARFLSKNKEEPVHMFLPLLPQDIYSINIKTIYTRNIWILMLYSAFHMLDVNVNYLGNVE